MQTAIDVIRHGRRGALKEGDESPSSGRFSLDSPATAGCNESMSIETQELMRICESLPEAKRAEVADFARFLLAREDDERWEQLIASGQRRPKLDAFLRQSSAEPASPIDLERL
jgi:hypothetical protein